jgi:quinol monooxygenase YgiN
MSATLFVKHKVTDYKTWKSAYDDFGPVRKQKGVTAASVHRDPKDQNVVTVTHRFNDLSAATIFAGSDELKSTIAKAGVQGSPEIWFSEDIEHTPF